MLLRACFFFCGRRFSCAIMHPPQAVTPSFPASRGRCISVVAAALLFIGFCGLFICGAVRAEGASRLPVYGVTLLMLFCVCWLVFGELRRSAVRLRIDGGVLVVTPFAGLGFTRRYDLKSFDAVTSTILVSRGGAYEYRYLMKAGRRVVRVSSFYLKNYREISEALSGALRLQGPAGR